MPPMRHQKRDSKCAAEVGEIIADGGGYEGDCTVNMQDRKPV